MRNQLLPGLVLVCWLATSAVQAQFGQNLQGQNPPANANFLPRAGGPWLNSQQFYPYGYGNPLNNYLNNAFYGNTGFNPYGGAGFGSPWNNPFGNPWQGNGFGGGFANPFQANGFGMGFGNPFTPWGSTTSFIAPPGPFGGYQYYGYGNFSPIVGTNNGWWPYSAPFDYNNPVNQYLQNLYLQGLPGSNFMPGSNRSPAQR